jgi:3-oxoacyl-[acyl-carrier protein] reductase
MSDHPITALVTGAGSGIGAAIAVELAAAGARVVVLDRDGAAAEKVAKAIGGTSSAVAADITLQADLDRVAALVAQTGLDVLVNCAGVSDATPTAELGIATFRRVIDINLTGAVELTLRMLPLLRASEQGRVVNIASIQGMVPAADTLAYATSKGGMIAFTKALATDLAPDAVLVNAVAPGFVNTPMAVLPEGITEYETEWFKRIYVEHGRLPLRRPAEPDEIARVVAFLASDANTYVTGQVVTVDGGLTSTF